VTSPSPGGIRARLAPRPVAAALLAGLALVAAACSSDPDTAHAGDNLLTDASLPPVTEPTSTTADPVSTTVTKGSVDSALDPAAPPTLPPGTALASGSTPATATAAAQPATTARPAPAGGGASPAPVATVKPVATPAVPGAQAQPGDPNDAFNGGGPVSCQVFPADNWWNRDVRNLPVHAQSAAWVSSLGSGRVHPDFGTVWEGKGIGIPYVVVNGSQPRVPVSFGYAGESDPGPYPIPANAPVEDGSDRHLLVVDDTNCKLYELFDASTSDGGASWRAGSGAVFDLGSNGLRPASWTSADAAGLPIFAGLATYEEVVVQGHIDHALRFTAARTQRAYIKPATHFASSITDPGVPPMGARFRLKASADCSSFSAEAQVICAALKTYGMYLADNGSDWMISGAPDPRWNDQALADLHKLNGSMFEVVDTGEPLVR